jgi:tripartite-type tricarboxylate transporter receptor subunit TctC
MCDPSMEHGLRAAREDALAYATQMIRCAAALAATVAATTVANAQWQPQKPVEFIVTAGAGGGTDIFARTVQKGIPT